MVDNGPSWFFAVDYGDPYPGSDDSGGIAEGYRMAREKEIAGTKEGIEEKKIPVISRENQKVIVLHSVNQTEDLEPMARLVDEKRR